MAIELPNQQPGQLNYLSSLLSLSCNNSNDDNCKLDITMVRVRDLAKGLSKECCELDSQLFELNKSLSKLIISWISSSLAAKTAIHNINLTTSSSPGGLGFLSIQQIVKQDLQLLAMELKQIQNIRSYLNTAIQLEAMIGDLEDAAFSVMSQRAGNDQESRQHNFFQIIRFMNKIEDLLVNPLQFKGQWCHLMKAVDSRVDKTLAFLRPQVLASHRALLSSLGWPPRVLSSNVESGNVSSLPNPLILMQTNKHKAYVESFLALCAIQHLQTRREKRQLGLSVLEKNKNFGLWAIDELVRPISSRMEFHCSKWTDQPELIFALVYKITQDFMVGIDDTLQPLIDKAKLVGFSAKEAWVSAMVQMLSVFLAKRFFSILSKRYKEKETRAEVRSLWLHLVDLMVKYDKQFLSLVSSDAYLIYEDSERRGESSKGLSVFSLFSDKPDWLKIWAKIELNDNKVKLKEETKNENAWLINSKQGDNSVAQKSIENFVFYSREDFNAPLIAEYALKLSWETIERCIALSGVFTRVKFIKSTSAKVIWYFMNLLISRFKGTENSAANFDDDSLVKLCGLINAAKYCEYKLQEWSDDIYFLEMSIAKTECNKFREDDVDDNGLFFREEIKSLADLELSWLMQIITGLLNQFENLTLDYVHNKLQFKQEEKQDHLLRVSEASAISVSNDLVEALDTLRSQLCIIKGSLNPKDFSDLWRNLAHALDHFVFGSIFMTSHKFSEKETKQFEADMEALFLVFKPMCARPDVFFPSIRDGLRCLVIDKQKK